MSELQIFKNPAFGQIRTIKEPNGSLLFVGNDIAGAFGYTNLQKAIRDHCKGCTKRSLPTSSGVQSLNCIPQGDVIRLAAQSKLPGAAKFESWIFDEVIPQVMQSGTYSAPQATPVTSLDIAQHLLDAAREQDKRISQLEGKQSKLEQAIASAVQPVDWKAEIKSRVESITGKAFRRSGLFLAGVYSNLEQAENVALNSRMTRQRKRMKACGATANELKNLSKLDIIAQDECLKSKFETMLDRVVM